jgi:hypothetical protein
MASGNADENARSKPKPRKEAFFIAGAQNTVAFGAGSLKRANQKGEGSAEAGFYCAILVRR